MKSLVAVVSLFAIASLRAQPTPLNQVIPERAETGITCEVTQAPPAAGLPGLTTPQECESVKGVYHYKLWLPKGYHADTKRHWACVFITSPDGDATMGPMADWLKANDYVVVLLVDAKNGPWSPIIGNFLAAHDDVIRRVRIQNGLKIATGLSGGARASSLFVQLRPGFSGLLLQGAGPAFRDDGVYYSVGLKRPPLMDVVMTMGSTDTHRTEIARVRALLGPQHFLALDFSGGNVWAPQPVVEEAFQWMERQIYEVGPALPMFKSIYPEHAKTLLHRLAATTDLWSRYKLGESFLQFCQARHLTDDPALADGLTKLQTDMANWRTDPVIAQEIAAADALRQLLQSRSRMAPAAFAENCRNLANQYAGTEAGNKATDLAGTIK